MTVIKCDLCGAYVDNLADSTELSVCTRKANGERDNVDVKEICKRCEARLYQWFKQPSC